MYDRTIESNPEKMAEHNKTQKELASRRQRENAERKAKSKGR